MRLLFFLACFFALVPNAYPSSIHLEFPDTVSPQKRYLFYVHGRIVESEGINAVSPVFGRYQLHQIVSALTGNNRVVIAHVRTSDTDMFVYVHRLASEVRRLIARGVPADHITVAGFSKGGYIALLTAKALQNPAVKFVVMAGCHGGIIDGSNTSADGLQGTILSMVGEQDTLGCSCKPLFQRNPQLARHKDLIFQGGANHGFFYRADPVWVELLLQWAGE